MLRRGFLGALALPVAGSLPGCSTVQSSETPSSAGSTEQAPRPFGFAATVVTERPSTESPPVIRVGIKNEDATSHILTIPNNAFPFSTASASTAGNTLVLEETIPETRDGECWTGHAKKRPMVSGKRFAPGESVSREYAVLNSPKPASCWPPGKYEFIETYYLDPENDHSKTGGTEFEWGFTVTVKKDTSIAIHE